MPGAAILSQLVLAHVADGPRHRTCFSLPLGVVYSIFHILTSLSSLFFGCILIASLDDLFSLLWAYKVDCILLG